MVNIKDFLNRGKEKRMGKMGSTFLDANDVFPEIDLTLVSGETLKLAGRKGEGYTVVLFYRGYW